MKKYPQYRSPYNYSRPFNTQRTFTKVTCSKCGQETEVPFTPTEGREVFCKICLKENQEENI